MSRKYYPSMGQNRTHKKCSLGMTDPNLPILTSDELDDMNELALSMQCVDPRSKNFRKVVIYRDTYNKLLYEISAVRMFDEFTSMLDDPLPSTRKFDELFSRRSRFSAEGENN